MNYFSPIGDLVGSPENKFHGEVQSSQEVLQLKFDSLEKGVVQVFCTLYGCSEANGNCFMKSFLHNIPILGNDGDVKESNEVILKCSLEI